MRSSIRWGVVSANSAVAGANGKIIFKSSGDTLLGAGSVTTATGAGSGGSIEVTGNRVALTDDAIVDVSGQTGGGTVLIGGDERGSNPAIQNAALTYVGPTTQIKADALQSGDGGKVIVWSDQQTRMYGNVSARGAGLRRQRRLRRNFQQRLPRLSRCRGSACVVRSFRHFVARSERHYDPRGRVELT